MSTSSQDVETPPPDGDAPASANLPDRSLGKEEPVRSLVGASQVAQMANVSVMTVSRVLNGSNLVSKRTRQRVLEAADKLSYQPNLAARALRTGKVESFGFVVGSPASLLGQFHSETLAAFESVIAPRGLGLSITVLPPEMELTTMATRLAASGRVGAMVVRLDAVTQEHINSLQDCGVPVVLANYTARHSTGVPVSSVGFDNSLGTAQAVRHLHALGHRNIAYIGGTPGWSDSIQREEGFRRGLEDVDVPPQASLIREGDFALGFEAALATTTDLLASGGIKPTAFVCASDEIAAGVMEAARRWNLAIPTDLSVIGYDDSKWCQYVTPNLTSVRHTGWELGENLGNVLLHLFDHPNASTRHVVLETQLVVRGTTGPVPAA